MLTRRSVLCSFTTALALSGTMGASGCFGRFALVNKVYEFNKTGVSEDLVVQEILFLAMIIIPVYGVAAVVDAIVLNPIEVFTGSNPIADASPQESHTITLEEGVVTLIGTDDGLRIERNLSGEVEVFTLRADGMGWILTDGDGEVVGATEPLMDGTFRLVDRAGRVLAQPGRAMVADLDDAWLLHGARGLVMAAERHGFGRSALVLAGPVGGAR